MTSEANSIPMPGPSGDASDNGPINIGPWSVRKIVKYDWRVWQMTGNAIITSLAELDKPEEDRKLVTDDVSSAVMIWMLTHTCAEVSQALKSGTEQFKEMCSSETEQKMEVPEFNSLFSAVMEQIRRAASTAIKYGEEKDGDGKTVFFPGSKTSPETALVG